MKQIALSLFLAVACTALGGCCGGGDGGGGAPSGAPGPAPPVAPAPAEAAPAGPRVKTATFCKSLTDQMAPVGPTSTFHPSEKVHVSLTVEGRPRRGVVGGTFMYRDQAIASASADFASANSGVIFSFGQDTLIGFWLTTTEPLYVSDRYRLAVTVDGAPAGEYPFTVVGPPGAMASRLHHAALAKGVTPDTTPVEPTSTFAPNDIVHVVGLADLGDRSWIQAEWWINGTKHPASERFFTAEGNRSGLPFYFSNRPEGGWPAGTHVVKLLVDDREVGVYPLTVGGGTPAGAPVPPPIAPIEPPAAP
jgi:hypothetical protein